ncbi:MULTISPECIES: sensor histidine kinase [Thermus]|uniref:sensor histidine kinase n=1 Tax=Thermus TaxID=270 RepID=UPI001F457495|nr:MULTISPECIES: HAMP domain-containing sensor histidine kinase [Thermus]
MTLKGRLAWAFFLVAACTGLASLLGGYAVFWNLVERDIALDLGEAASKVQRALVLTPEGPRLTSAEAFSGSHYVFGFRLLEAGTPILEGGFFPQAGEAWRTLSLPWQGYQLEVYLRTEEYTRALRAYVRGGLLLLFPLLFLATLFGYGFARLIVRPLDELARAVEAVSLLRFPEPLAPGREREIRRLVQGFNRMAEAVRAALERERLFTRHASHELRSPLAVIRSQVEALQGGLLPLKRALPQLAQSVDRMEAVLRGLLALARSEGADLAPLELSAFLGEYLAGEEGVRASLQGPAWVLAHPALLERILDNLLENARRHGAPPVEVRLGVRGEEVILEVRDHGPGVAPEDLSRLAEPFFRGQMAGDGLGLGLALAQEAARRLGGTLEVENAQPGLRVRVRLPRWEDGAAAGSL